jgi:hypothetical protein
MLPAITHSNSARFWFALLGEVAACAISYFTKHVTEEWQARACRHE